MSNWRALVDEALRTENNRYNRNDSPVSAPNVPIVPNVLPLNPVSTLREWRVGLARVDDCQPPDGWHINRWQQLCDDAVWLMENFAEQATRDGWSTADLFGLWPAKPHLGGIADRLRGSRSLVMDADRASWRTWGKIVRFNRGSYPELQPFWKTVPFSRPKGRLT